MSHKLLTLFLGTVFLAHTGASAGGENLTQDVVIYYVPFKLETYVPITKLTIKKEAWYRLETKMTHPDVEEVTGFLQSASASHMTFDRKRVRMKIDGVHTESIFIDAEGVVIQEGELFKLEQFALEKLDSLLRATGEGCKRI